MSEFIKYEQLFKEGKISRRGFLKRASALGAAAILSPALTATPLQGATPQKGGVLRLATAHGETSDTLDPAVFVHAMTGTMRLSYGNTLVEISPDGAPTPVLAESWEASKDVKTWTFKIRKGVEFHNGKTLDAKDVIASINHHRQEGTKSGAKVVLNPVVDIKADGNHTLVFTLDEPNADFPYIMADINLIIMPAKGDLADWQSGIGTGAYVLKEFEPGVRISMDRFANHWNPNRGHFDRVEMLTIHDPSTRTNALVTGNVDVIDRPELRSLHILEKKPGIRIDETTSYGHYSIPMLTDVSPFDNNDVRLALKYALDREAVLKILFRGHGSLGNDHPISPANRFHAKDLPQRVYDPDKAKFHLKKAGVDSLTVPLHSAAAAFPEAVDLSVLYKEHAANAGITINVVREPNDGYWSSIWMKKPWCFGYWRGRPTEDWMFSSAYAKDAKWNESHWKNERFNALLVEARSELDVAKRREMYVEMQRIVKDEGGTVVPIFNNYILVCNEKLQHGPMLRYADVDGYKLPERWWFS